jgi:hypothetical protein
VVLVVHEVVASAIVRNLSQIAVEARIEERMVTVLDDNHGTWLSRPAGPGYAERDDPVGSEVPRLRQAKR